MIPASFPLSVTDELTNNPDEPLCGKALLSGYTVDGTFQQYCIAKAAHDIESAVTASPTTLTQLHGIGTLTAGHGRRIGGGCLTSLMRSRSWAAPSPTSTKAWAAAISMPACC